MDLQKKNHEELFEKNEWICKLQKKNKQKKLFKC